MIAEQFPTLVPQILAIHDEQQWLLMKAAPGEKVPPDANLLAYLLRWKTLLQTYEHMQQTLYSTCIQPGKTIREKLDQSGPSLEYICET